MKTIFVAIAALIHTLILLSRPNGSRAVMAEVLALRVQLLTVKRKSPRAPKLSPMIRLLLAICGGLVKPNRLAKTFILVKPATVLKFHRYLVRRKYKMLFSSNNRGVAGRPPIDTEIRKLILEIKSNNPRFGCPQIAALVKDRTGVAVSIETVRRILKGRKSDGTGGDGPSWLTFLGQTVDSLWSVDLFKIESVILKTHWVMVVMDQFSRRIVGFAVTAGAVDGASLCYMFNRITAGGPYPKRLSHDNDPLFHYHQWSANLDMSGIEEIWSIPFQPTSHPFVERLIGTVRREFTDHQLFWNAADLERKLAQYQRYFNEARVHAGIAGMTPIKKIRGIGPTGALPGDLKWQSFCRGLFRVPVAS